MSTADAVDPSYELLPAEARVLGCLIEKSITTPDAYPLSVNSIRLACNQTTNRDPITHFDDATVEHALDGLRAKQLARRLKNPGERAIKHRHVVADAWSLDAAEVAVLCVLLLRGAQTPGEIKQRTERLHAFASLEALDATLASLSARGFVAQLERRAGQKEARWRELCVAPDASSTASLDTADVVAVTPPEVEAHTLAVCDRDGSVVRTMAVDSERDVDARLLRARRALADWRDLGAAERRTRGTVGLDRVAAAAESLGALVAMQQGGDADEIALELIAVTERARAALNEAAREPVGVIAMVYSAAAGLPVSAIAAALGAGDVVMLKPSASALLAALAFVDEFHAAGVPADALQCLVGGASTGAVLAHAGADLVQFDGGHEAGINAARVAGERKIPIDLRLR